MKHKMHRNHVGYGILAVTLLAATAFAEFPVQDMDVRALGLQYGLTFRGENITKAATPGHETAHALTLAYAPVPYAVLEAGIGVDKFEVESVQSPAKTTAFSGDYGIAPSFGLSLYTPPVADMLRATLGVKTLFLNSSDAKGYTYSGFLHAPFLGLTLAPSGYFCVGVGMRAVYLDGTMEGPGTNLAFSNGQLFRGYLSVTLKSPAERAFLTLDLDASPDIDADWSNGPREASVAISFGAMLGWKPHPNAAAIDSSAYFPAYPEMKAKAKKMAGEIE